MTKFKAKTIRWDLQIRQDQGIKASNMTELRNHLQDCKYLDEIVKLTREGELVRWLQNHQHITEMGQIKSLIDTHETHEDTALFAAIGRILGVNRLIFKTISDKTLITSIEGNTMTTREKNISTLRDQAIHLLHHEIEILQKMLDAPGVLVDAIADEKQTLDRTSASEKIKMLQDEVAKLNRLEMVLAVVGTMKAGKSTTINAIVGTEVLPNRNRPMTALPTLIRHTPGQIEPLLQFNNLEPITRLLGEINKAAANSVALEKLDEDMQGLLAGIRKNAHKPKSDYEGVEAIFEFLKMLNDLVRLSTALKLEFPFDQYKRIDDLPCIAVEFVHLRETDKQQGQLTLLDTPGPNEAGQQHLRQMLREEIRKASAVMAVFDYTQLKSDADQDVRNQLMEIAEVSKGRMYALVNKFDQKDRNGDGKEQVKTLVATSLMQGKIPPTHVFPVSSRWGYLANRARHELLSVNKCLPDADKNPWVQDFMESGKLWDEDINDSEKVGKSIDNLWKTSLFQDPLENIIKTAHAQASLLALDSAAAKLVDTSTLINNLLKTRETAFSKSTGELQKSIQDLQQDIAKVADCEKQAKLMSEKLLRELLASSGKLFEAARQETEEEMKKYFEEGKGIEKQVHQKKAEERKKEMEERQKIINESPFLSIVSVLFGLQTKIVYSNEQDFDSNSPIIKFDDSKKAYDLVLKVNKSLSNIVEKTNKDMEEGMNALVQEFQKEFEASTIQEARKIISATQSKLKGAGFDISLEVPSPKLLKLELSGSDMLQDAVQKQVTSKHGTKVRDSIWASFIHIFNDNWGTESYSYDQTSYNVDIDVIKELTLKQLEELFSGLNESIAARIQQPLDENIRQFFDEFSQKLEAVRGDLLAGIRDKEKSRQDQEALLQQLGAMQRGRPEVSVAAIGIKQETDLGLKNRQTVA